MLSLVPGAARERISLDRTIDLCTRGSAFTEFTADLVVFKEDLDKIQPKKILTTPVDLTMGGSVVFERTPRP